LNGKVGPVEALDLDPCGYTGTYKLIGGRVCLDFVNTISWPHTERRHDWLSSLANVRRWADAVRLDARRIRVRDLDQIRTTRTVLTELIRPLTHEEQPTRSAIGDFNRALSSTGSRRSLDPTTLTWTWCDQTPIETFLDPIVLDSAELVSVQARSRLGHCPDCDWAFYDETRNGRRRWCDMADCGSRAKSRRYYERTTA
jgi:predicted RNA-binding Zn ribbon-like protein